MTARSVYRSLQEQQPDDEGTLRPDAVNQETADAFFRQLRKGGRVNMLGAAPYLAFYWGIPLDEATKYHLEWMYMKRRVQMWMLLGFTEEHRDKLIYEIIGS